MYAIRSYYAQGDLGGKNAVQIGLGTNINSVTRIHSQGSVQNTDKNTDVAVITSYSIHYTKLYDDIEVIGT